MTRLLEMRGIVKTYGPVRANDGIDLDVEAGQIVGLLGENGSGKSTLMKVLFGMVEPDTGGIVYKGHELSGHNPKAAIALGIGMIHQHFMLIEAMTVAENIMLGWGEAGRWLKRREIATEIREASRKFGLDLDPDTVVGTLSLGRQRIEILKAVMRGAELLILDEPTSNLAPQEVSGLLGVMRQLRAAGKGIIFISHKMAEVMAVCDEVVVLRDGRVAGRRSVADASEADLAHMMVGRDIAHPLGRIDTGTGGTTLLEVRNLCVDARDGIALSDIDFELKAGEVLALAGVDGNGQFELVETLAGLRRASSGTVRLNGADITRAGVARRVAAGLAYIPADRSTTSLIQSMTIAENLSLRDIFRPPYARGPWLDRKGRSAAAHRMIEQFSIRAPGPETIARQLSGGNQQKVVIAREIARAPRVLVAFQATWGLDPGATRFVREQVVALRNAGNAVLYISSELEEVLALGDRVGVMFGGRLLEVARRESLDLGRIGLLMSGQVAA
jgi:simple sugar transport system ATP-binding protein